MCIAVTMATSTALGAADHKVFLMSEEESFIPTQVYFDQHLDILDAFNHLHNVEVAAQ